MPDFKKAEKLCSKKSIDRIFEKKQFLNKDYIRLFYNFIPSTESDTIWAQIAFSVPKRKFRSAVMRNRIKRQLREAYRLSKDEFYTSLKKANKRAHLLLVYMGKEKADFNDLKLKINLLLKRLLEQDEQPSGQSSNGTY
jgi:ribonuclease P protein component